MDPAKGSWGHSAAWGSRPRSVPGFGVPDAQGSDGSHSRWAEWLWGLRPFDLQAGGRDHPWRSPGRLSSDRSARPLGACASSPCLPHPSAQGAGAGGKRREEKRPHSDTAWSTGWKAQALWAWERGRLRATSRLRLCRGSRNSVSRAQDGAGWGKGVGQGQELCGVCAQVSQLSWRSH